MATDQPFFAVDAEAPADSELELDGRKVVKDDTHRADAPRELTPTEKLVAILRKSKAWGPDPTIADQEFIAEDTVRIVGAITRTFDPGEEGDRKMLGQIELSNLRRGRYLILRGPQSACFEHLGKWSILVTYLEREFKQVDEEESKRKPGSPEGAKKPD